MVPKRYALVSDILTALIVMRYLSSRFCDENRVDLRDGCCGQHVLTSMVGLLTWSIAEVVLQDTINEHQRHSRELYKNDTWVLKDRRKNRTIQCRSSLPWIRITRIRGHQWSDCSHSMDFNPTHLPPTFSTASSDLSGEAMSRLAFETLWFVWLTVLATRFCCAELLTTTSPCSKRFC